MTCRLFSIHADFIEIGFIGIMQYMYAVTLSGSAVMLPSRDGGCLYMCGWLCYLCVLYIIY